MQPIQLTQEHRNKIIEMCKVLFPETPYVHFYKGYDRDKFSIGNYDMGEKWDIENKPQLIDDFHWFEFVWIFLVSRLQDVIDTKLGEDIVFEEQPPYVGNVYGWQKGNRWTIYAKFMFLYPKTINEKHPVDFLYEYFQKIPQ